MGKKNKDKNLQKGNKNPTTPQTEQKGFNSPSKESVSGKISKNKN